MLTPSRDVSVCRSESPGVESLSFIWICDEDSTNPLQTLASYLAAMREQSLCWELVVVTNGLRDRSFDISGLLSRQGIEASLINFNARCPSSNAFSVALEQSTGDAVVVLPSYLQSSPSDINRVIAALNDGSDYVASRRTPRIDSKYSQRESAVFNALTRWITGIQLRDINSQLRAIRREVFEALPIYGDPRLHLPVFASQQGFRVQEIPVRHLNEHQTNERGVGMYLQRALDLLALSFLTRFTSKPFRFFGGIGSGLLGMGAVINLGLAVQKLLFQDSLADRPMLVLATLLMVLGIQMLSLGLIGELIIFVNAGGLNDYEIEHTYESNKKAA